MGSALVAMFDPAVPASLWTTAGMSQQVASDGDPVGRWRDLTPNGNDWRQTQVSAPDYRPVWKAAGLNGRPSVRFAGAQLLSMLDSATYKNNTIWCMMALTSTVAGTV